MPSREQGTFRQVRRQRSLRGCRRAARRAGRTCLSRRSLLERRGSQYVHTIVCNQNDRGPRDSRASGEAWAPRWESSARDPRTEIGVTMSEALVYRYGTDPSQFGELWLPEGAALGTVVLLHGGFWRAQYDLSRIRPLA